MDQRSLDRITESVGGQPRRPERIQSLWSGYGEILRVPIDRGRVPSVIVKRVTPESTDQHPRGWSGRTGHERKLRSYEVERSLYSRWLSEPDADHRTARCYSAESTSEGFCFVLEDLDAAGFDRRLQSLDDSSFEHCLSWLASFHARFLGVRPEGLWPVGTYWHLDTRPDEFGAMPEGSLKDAAKTLDRLLKECRFQTFVHGDAKVANFCFGPGGVAAVDFQYVGGGCGIKDVAYFLSSCLSDHECEAQAETHLDTYFGLLRAHLPASIDHDAVCEEWRSLYPAAWADFHRFLAGWSPDHWKIHRYTTRMTELALSRL